MPDSHISTETVILSGTGKVHKPVSHLCPDCLAPFLTCLLPRDKPCFSERWKYNQTVPTLPLLVLGEATPRTLPWSWSYLVVGRGRFVDVDQTSRKIRGQASYVSLGKVGRRKFQFRGRKSRWGGSNTTPPLASSLYCVFVLCDGGTYSDTDTLTLTLNAKHLFSIQRSNVYSFLVLLCCFEGPGKDRQLLWKLALRHWH